MANPTKQQQQEAANMILECDRKVITDAEALIVEFRQKVSDLLENLPDTPVPTAAIQFAQRLDGVFSSHMGYEIPALKTQYGIAQTPLPTVTP